MPPNNPNIPTALSNLCLGIPTRSVGRGDPVADYAENIARFLFMPKFMAAHPGGIVLSQTEFRAVRTAFPAVNRLLNSMADDFKNLFTRSSRQAATAAGDLSKLKPGGFLKPDVLGISAPEADGITVELLEVTTVGEADATIQQDINNKLDILNTVVLPVLQAQVQAESPMSFPPVKVMASKWRPGPGELTWPLVNSAVTSGSRQIEWICYKPTFRFSPPNGIDGLILYEVHRVPLPMPVPKEVVDKLKEELRRKNLRSGPQLLPAYQQYWQANPIDRDLLTKLALIAAIGVGVALVIAFLPEEVLVGLATLAARGLAMGIEAAVDLVGEAVEALPRAIEAVGRIFQSLNLTGAPLG